MRTGNFLPGHPRDRAYVLRIDLDRVVRGADAVGWKASDAYLLLWRGPQTAAVPALDEVRAAIPVGTGVIGYLNPANDWGVDSPDLAEDQMFWEEIEGVPPRRLLFDAFGRCAQALIFDQGEHELAHWRGYTFDELAQQLDRLHADQPVPGLVD